MFVFVQCCLLFDVGEREERDVGIEVVSTVSMCWGYCSCGFLYMGVYVYLVLVGDTFGYCLFVVFVLYLFFVLVYACCIGVFERVLARRIQRCIPMFVQGGRNEMTRFSTGDGSNKDICSSF